MICTVHSKYPQSGYIHFCITRYAGYAMSTTWLRLFLHEQNKNCDQSLNILLLFRIYKFFSSKGKSQFITLYLFVISDRMVRPELPPRSIALGSADIPVCAFLNYVLSLGLLVLWNRKYILTLLYIFYSHFILYLYCICFGSFYLTSTISLYRDRLIYKYENTII